MQCNFLSMVNSVYSCSVNNQGAGSPSFCGKAQEKLLQKIMDTKRLKDMKVTFDELNRIYEHLGYDVMMKRGSHAIVNVRGTNIPIVIPHKDKYVHPNDLKRLKLIMAGEEKKAQMV